ncbi:hypothetical protein OROGR_002865 [Orobanche gracilis]
MENLMSLMILVLFSLLQPAVSTWSLGQQYYHNQEKKNEGSSYKPIDGPIYHDGPILTSQINIDIIWYGKWNTSHQSIIRDFINSISSPATEHPSVSEWWHTVTLYDDRNGSKVNNIIKISGEHPDSEYSQGKHLTRASMQDVIKNAVTTSSSLPPRLDYTNGMYLILTSSEVMVDEFCRAVCGYHYFTNITSTVGVTVPMPYAWIGHSGTQCPGHCAIPFAWSNASGQTPPAALGAPNGDVGTDGMISVIAHELAEASTNPLITAWYAGDPIAPSEIADMCIGKYGNGAGGSYIGAVYSDSRGNAYNLNGVNGRFLVQWVWDRFKNKCYGPNSSD